MRLIDADALKKDISGAKKLGIEAVAYYIDQQPTAVVRCGECKYSSKPDTNGEIWCKREDHGEDLMECHGVGWFCADGERKWFGVEPPKEDA